MVADQASPEFDVAVTRSSKQGRGPARPLGLDPSRRRLAMVLVVTALLFSAVVVRLTEVQVLASDRYTDMSEDQRMRSVKLSSDRGAVFDRHGNELAISVPQKTVWADPSLVTDPYRTSALLAPVLDMDQSTLDQLLRKQGRFVYLQRKVTDEVAARVAEMKLPGVEMYDEPKRFLPGGDLMSPVLGRVGIDGEGLSGVESQYEGQLAGKAGKMVVEQDPGGRDIPGGIRKTQEPQRGDDLVLTIDRDLQYKTEQALKAEIEKSNAKGGIAALMDTKSGEILSLANLSVPNGGRGKPVQPSVNNMALTNVYEPGSTNKLITISGAMEEGLVQPASSMVVGNQMQIGDAIFKEHEEHPVMSWNTTDIVANSSNIGTIMIGQKLGKERLDKYMRSFGLGSTTGLGYPGESKGLMIDPKKYSGSSLPSIAIGQGVAVTTMQMLAAYNTVANEGNYVAPKLVRSFIDEEGKEQPTKPSETRRVVSTRTANQMSAMLKEVVRVGTATAAQIQGYEVAGKTGTARKPKEGASGYEQGAYVSSFAGFVPAEKPQLTGIVLLDQPTPIFGGLVAAPVFSDIARYGIQGMQVPPVGTDAGNHGVPLVNSETASGVGEADAPAGTTKEQAESVKATANSRRDDEPSDSTSSTTSDSSRSSTTTTAPKRKTTTTTSAGSASTR